MKLAIHMCIGNGQGRPHENKIVLKQIIILTKISRMLLIGLVMVAG